MLMKVKKTKRKFMDSLIIERDEQLLLLFDYFSSIEEANKKTWRRPTSEINGNKIYHIERVNGTFALYFHNPIQIEIVTALFQLGTTQRKELEKTLKIPRSTIYGHLKGLMNRKIVLRIEFKDPHKLGRPLVFWTLDYLYSKKLRNRIKKYLKMMKK